MANAKSLKLKIKSTWNIKKITRALEIVSTLKLQKLKKKCDAHKQFLQELLCLALHIHSSQSLERDTLVSGRHLAIVITSEKGLCGAINTKVCRQVLKTYAFIDQVDIFVIGKKAYEFFQKQHLPTIGVSHVRDDMVWEELNVLYDFIKQQNYVAIDLHFTYFKNTLQQYPMFIPLMPMDEDKFKEILKVWWHHPNNFHDLDISLEPNVQDFMSSLKENLLEQVIYGGVLQSKTSEMAARMIAMKKAKDNSTDRIKQLTLAFNTARQAAITQEIMEIVAAKAAIE